ncbi:hypothetical protein OH690_05165 [Escherichia coli]|nr:hypothetical protein [Escherichia coli]
MGRLLACEKDPLGFTTQFRHSKIHAGPQGLRGRNPAPGRRAGTDAPEQRKATQEKLYRMARAKPLRYEYGGIRSAHGSGAVLTASGWRRRLR